MAPLFQAAKIPMIAPASTNPQVTLTGNYIFRTCFIDPFQGRILAKFVVKDLKMKTAGVLINANSKYSEGLAKSFIEYFVSQKGEILFEENYLEQTVDFSPIISKIEVFQPEILFLPGHNKDSGYIIRQTRDCKIFTPFIGGDGWSNDLYKIAGKGIEGNFYSLHWHKDSAGIKSRQFVKNYKKHFQEFDDRDALSYDTVCLFIDAVNRTQSLDPVQIRNALASTENFQGVTGKISFDKNGDPIKSAVILKYDKGGSVYVKTMEP
jgi:branched-chain amino acid transport system substrate-binding protein